MMYADYDFYIETYQGNLITSVEDFNRMSTEASSYLDSITLGGISPSDISSRIKLATCAVAEVCFMQFTNEQKKEISSETVGPHSVSYVKKSKSYEDYQKEKMSKAKLYLATTGLLYCGVASCNF